MKHRPGQAKWTVPYFRGIVWGWPCKALWYDWETVTVAQANLKNAIPLPSTIIHRDRAGGVYSLPRGLPLGFVDRGFIINSLFYAAVLWLLICGPLALRRFVRVKRGLCPACAYPMGQSDACSECGKPLPGRMAVTT